MSAFQAAQLRKVSQTIFTSSVGTLQAPVSGATVQVYRAGMFVRATNSLAGGATGVLKVAEPGQVEVGDVLQIGTSSSPTATVNSISQNGFDWEVNVTIAGGTWNPAVGAWIVNTSRRPTLYANRGGTTSSNGVCTLSGSTCTTTSNGLAEFYVEPAAVDLIVSGGTPSIAAHIIRDADSGHGPDYFNLRTDFGGKLKLAVAALKTNGWLNQRGAEVFIPPGTYVYDTPDFPVTIDTRITLRGAGPRSALLVVNNVAAYADEDFIRIEKEDVHLSDFAIAYAGSSSVAGDGHAIKIGRSDLVGTGYVSIKNLDIDGSPNSAIYIGGDYIYADTFGSLDVLEISRCRIGGTRSGADIEMLDRSTLITIEDTSMGELFSGPRATGTYGVLIQAVANLRIINSQILPSDLNTECIKTTGAGFGSGPKIYSAHVHIEGCDFEFNVDPTTETTPLVSLLGLTSCTVKNCLFYEFGSGLLLDGTYGANIEGNIFKRMGGSGYQIKIEDTVHTRLENNVFEKLDTAPDNGARLPATITRAGTNNGLRINGSAAYYADDTARDAVSYSSGVDVAGAIREKGNIVWVDSPTSPTSKLQVWNGSGWEGIGEEDGSKID